LDQIVYRDVIEAHRSELFHVSLAHRLR
jgi:hypothetical protein